ncbi:UDP-3-O-(3-hydroxymyristoyl)glucosamine N-acyltransferase [Gynurincola endophyticus]|uniref:UDP-3-O-(3-hydroxymyristoyl)glucosamine N-acyltransferase n=1 Tax=Gynurincola endophyticus TaxID=2479004 RepID=UPI000F8C383E|nr:UDP-3-O-(3-hydroxymyristoyl)glucosamine N-acyltransferase [Gynurincola endophyticus]
MKFEQPVTVDWMADFLGATIEGNKSDLITGINEIHKVEKGDLVFVDHPKYYDKCIQSDADFIIINQSTSFPPDKTLFIVDQPFEAYLKIVQHFRPFTETKEPVSSTLVVGQGSYIAPNVYIGKNVVIGKNCRIHPNVTIMDHVTIGDNVVIQAGSIIGSDAFYYNTKKNRSVWYKRMESCGGVIIEDDVEIGAGCTIDRGVTHNTVIGRGSKFDNMVHIGHDTVIGKNCLIAAQVGIAGATTLEDGVVLWGQVGVSKTLTIGENAVVLAQSGVPSSLAGNKTYFGYPAEDALSKKKELVWIKRIPEIWEKLKDKL